MDDVLQLLRANDDNKKFMGLMLATMLPKDEATLIAVYDAIGVEFINRLLLTLRSENKQEAELTLQQREVDESSATLGLAVMATLSAIPQIAASPEFMQNSPLLLKVLRNRGISQPSAAGSSPAAPTANDAVCIEIAVSCLTRMAENSQLAAEIALESGAIQAVLDALEDDTMALHVGNCRLVVAYLSCLLAATGCGPSLKRHSESLSKCTEPLAKLLARTLEESQPRHQPEAQQATHQPAQDQSEPEHSSDGQTTKGRSPDGQSADVLSQFSEGPEAQERQHSKAGSDGKAGGLPLALESLQLSQTSEQPGGGDGHAEARDDAIQLDPENAQQLQGALQLEALHALLLLLQAPQNQADQRPQYIADSGRGSASEWPDNVRSGLAAVMAAAAPPQTRQAALLLVARVTDLLGPLWLLSSQHVKGVKGGFYQLCLELTAVEVQVLLVEALRPPGSPRTPGRQEMEQVLVSCFNVLESLVAALVASDDMADDSSLVNDGVMYRVMKVMDEVFQAILEFITTALQADGVGDCLLVVAALKCLGRYLGQVPNAFTADVRTALPQLLAVTGGSDMPAGSRDDSMALRFLLPQLQQCVGGAPEAALPGIGLETDVWLQSLRDPVVIKLLCRGAAELASQSQHEVTGSPSGSMSDPEPRPGVESATNQLADYCAMMLVVAFDSKAAREDGKSSSLCLTSEAQQEVLSLVSLLCSQLALQGGKIEAMSSMSVPPCAIVRCITASAAFTAALLDEAAARELPSGCSTLLAAAFEIGFDVGQCLLRPPDLEQEAAVQSDADDAFAELTDEVQEWWFSMLPHLAALLRQRPNEVPDDSLANALRSKRSTQMLLGADKSGLQSLVGNSLTGSSPVLPLLEALR